MKRHFFTLILLFVSTLIYSQTLYVPGGVQDIEDSGNGNVGIGTSTPNQALDIVGDGIEGGQSEIDNNNKGFRILTKHYHIDQKPLTTLMGYTYNGVNSVRLGGGTSSGNYATEILFYTANNTTTSSTDDMVNHEKMRINSNGNVGIGTASPGDKLCITASGTERSFIKIAAKGSASAGIYFDASNGDFAGSDYGNLVQHDDLSIELNNFGENPISLNTNGETRLKISGNGNVGIGTITPNHMLDVAGTIHTQEVKVDMNGWSDFVFHPNYNLRPLKEVNTYIQQNGHLPEIPTAKEVEENGIDLGAMNAKLLQKIEELTLYTIEQQKTIDKLLENNEKLNERVETLENKK